MPTFLLSQIPLQMLEYWLQNDLLLSYQTTRTKMLVSKISTPQKSKSNNRSNTKRMRISHTSVMQGEKCKPGDARLICARDLHRLTLFPSALARFHPGFLSTHGETLEMILHKSSFPPLPAPIRQHNLIPAPLGMLSASTQGTRHKYLTLIPCLVKTFTVITRWSEN